MSMVSDDPTAYALASVSSAVAPLFRGRLCDRLLARRDARTFERHAVIFDLGETDRSLFFIRKGLVKTGWQRMRSIRSPSPSPPTCAG
jgi:hypothetical protein